MAQLFAVLSMLALFNVVALPLARAGEFAVESASAELKALFGDAAELCVHVDDSGAPLAPGHSHCDDGCPLCAFHGAVALMPPHGATLFVARRIAPAVPPIYRADTSPPLARASPAKPRAPPVLS